MYWCVKNMQIKKPFIRAIHNCLHIHISHHLGFSSVSSQSKIHLWHIRWYVPWTWSFALYFYTPSTQPWEKNGSKFLVNYPLKLGSQLCKKTFLNSSSWWIQSESNCWSINLVILNFFNLIYLAMSHGMDSSYHMQIKGLSHKMLLKTKPRLG